MVLRAKRCGIGCFDAGVTGLPTCGGKGVELWVPNVLPYGLAVNGGIAGLFCAGLLKQLHSIAKRNKDVFTAFVFG